MHAFHLLSLLALTAATPIALEARNATVKNVIPGKFIVSLKSGVNATLLQHVMSKVGGNFKHVYKIGTYHGFAGGLNTTQIQTLINHHAVDSIEPDYIVRTQAFITESNAPSWGLGRISHKGSGKGTSYPDYYYDSSAGANTCAYVLDTGIDITHPDFEGRASWANNFVDSSNTDGNGHGTHVSGTIGSKTYGVAKQTKLFAVKILGSDGTGAVSGVISGINWAAADAAKARKDGRCSAGTVGNLSLGTGVSSALNQAVKSAVQSGLFFAVAAGNSNQDASTTSPASEPSACTVGAIDESNTRASFSNYGSLVDIYAPGTNIVSTLPGGTTGTATGTSMASPHIAGLAAYFFGAANTPSQYKNGSAMCSLIVNVGLRGVMKEAVAGMSAANARISYNADGI